MGLEDGEISYEHLEGLNIHFNFLADPFQKLFHLRVYLIHSPTEQHSYFQEIKLLKKLKFLVGANFQPVVKEGFLDLFPQNLLVLPVLPQHIVMRIFQIFLPQIVVIVPVPQPQLEMEFSRVVFVSSVFSAQLVEKFNGINIEADVLRNFLDVCLECNLSGFDV